MNVELSDTVLQQLAEHAKRLGVRPEEWSVSPIELSESSESPALGLVPESKRKPWWRFW